MAASTRRLQNTTSTLRTIPPPAAPALYNNVSRGYAFARALASEDEDNILVQPWAILRTRSKGAVPHKTPPALGGPIDVRPNDDSSSRPNPNARRTGPLIIQPPVHVRQPGTLMGHLKPQAATKTPNLKADTPVGKAIDVQAPKPPARGVKRSVDVAVLDNSNQHATPRKARLFIRSPIAAADAQIYHETAFGEMRLQAERHKVGPGPSVRNLAPHQVCDKNVSQSAVRLHSRVPKPPIGDARMNQLGSRVAHRGSEHTAHVAQPCGKNPAKAWARHDFIDLAKDDDQPTHDSRHTPARHSRNFATRGLNIQTNVIDLTHDDPTYTLDDGHCFDCRRPLDGIHDDVYVAAECKAVFCGHCKGDKEHFACRSHNFTLQPVHKLFQRDCVICMADKSDFDLLDIHCGHPVCEGCMRDWAKRRAGQAASAHQPVNEVETQQYHCPYCPDMRMSIDECLRAGTLDHRVMS